MNTSHTQTNTTVTNGGRMQAGNQLLSASSVIGDEVHNLQNENLGTIHEIMLNVTNGRIHYAVLSSGGFLGMGERYFAVPWRALTLDAKNKRFSLDVDAKRLKAAPGFDKDQWPNMADPAWRSSVEDYYTR